MDTVTQYATHLKKIASIVQLSFVDVKKISLVAPESSVSQKCCAMFLSKKTDLVCLLVFLT